MADLKQYEDLAALVARLFMGALFVLYGYFKLTSYAATVTYTGRQGLPAPELFAALTVIIELGGGFLIVFGYQTRLVALGCTTYVLTAALIAHNFGDANQMSHFWKNMAIVGGLCPDGRRPWPLLGGWAQGIGPITSTRAHDGDDVAATATAAVRTFGGHGASYVALICLMEGRRFCKRLSFAIGIGDRRSAFGTGRKATVYAVAVRIVGDEKHSPLGIGGRDETEAKRGDEADQRCPHKVRPTCWELVSTMRTNR
jgi:putative oxidoreductase